MLPFYKLLGCGVKRACRVDFDYGAPGDEQTAHVLFDALLCVQRWAGL
ncbi:hypothetical protein [Candidatus Avelusimicrobium alvi]